MEMEKRVGYGEKDWRRRKGSEMEIRIGEGDKDRRGR